MRVLSMIATAGFVLATGAGAFAGELPSFETKSLPISTVQVQLLGATDVQEQAPAATLTAAGMPASPMQIAVLTPRAKQFAANVSAGH
jgi:hypothetical protein